MVTAFRLSNPSILIPAVTVHRYESALLVVTLKAASWAPHNPPEAPLIGPGSPGTPLEIFNTEGALVPQALEAVTSTVPVKVVAGKDIEADNPFGAGVTMALGTEQVHE
jgi:hypothetical protein